MSHVSAAALFNDRQGCTRATRAQQRGTLKVTGADLMKMAKRNGGRYNFNAVSGGALTALVKGKNLYIIDEHGTAAKLTIADGNQSNGVIHVVNEVLVPR
ncbi:MAG: fasciclin domain-containing protein [Methylobacterium mesophilicum]|nr:fasciclin domain-containing protein [Methylobacterium mesophilicum]